MLLKNTSKICVLLIVASLMLVISACGYHGDENLNQAPTIKITSYTGTDVKQDSTANPVPFQQAIYWAAEDVDGHIIGYAYRVLDENGISIPTPGHSVIDTDGNYADDFKSSFAKAKNHLGAIGVESNGWILHYKKGADESIPLESNKALKSIWSNKVFAVINFPANDGSEDGVGVLTPTPTRFEVVAIDNRGAISDVAVRYFITTSLEPTFFVTTSRGEFKEDPRDPVGLGIKVGFFMEDAFVGGIIPTKPWYFMYRLKRVNRLNPNEVIYESEWKSTKGKEKIDEVIITGRAPSHTDTDAFLVSNYNKDSDGIDLIPADSTQYSNVPTMHILEAKVVDLAGVVSDVSVNKFFVSDKYAPQTIFYPTHSYALGEHHFILQQDTNNNDVHPNMNSSEGMRMASNFTAYPIFNDNNEIIDFEWRIVGNEATRFWFRWGYRGEYESNNPNNKLVGIVRDSTAAQKNYFSEISNFYIQLNDKPYNFGPLNDAQTPETNVKYEEYLKVPANHQIAQRISFNNLTPNDPNDPEDYHVIKVIVEDLQNVLDPTPAVFKFKMVAPKPASDRQGVLYVNNNTTDGEGIVQAFYDNIFDEMGSSYQYIHRPSFRTKLSQFSSYDIRNGFHMFPLSFLQDYKHVIYATDSYNQKLNLEKDTDGVRLYLRNSGNVIIVGNYRLKEHHENDLLNNGDRLLINYFGFPNDRNDVQRLINADINIRTLRFYFIGAQATNSFPTLNAALKYKEDDIGAVDYNTDPFIRTWLNEHRVVVVNETGPNTNISDLQDHEKRNGLASVAYFTNHTADEVVYKFICKPTREPGNNRDVFKPVTSEERDLYHDKPIALRKAHGQGNAYTIGFPLLHMNRDHVKQLLTQILN